MPFLNVPQVSGINDAYNQSMSQIGQGVGAGMSGFLKQRKIANAIADLKEKMASGSISQEDLALKRAELGDVSGLKDWEAQIAKKTPVTVSPGMGQVFDETMPLPAKKFQGPTAEQIRQGTPDSAYIQPSGDAAQPYGKEPVYGKVNLKDGTQRPATPEDLATLIDQTATQKDSWTGKTMPREQLDDLSKFIPHIFESKNRAEIAKGQMDLREMLARMMEQGRNDRQQTAIDSRPDVTGSNQYSGTDANGNMVFFHTKGDPSPFAVPTPGGKPLGPKTEPTLPAGEAEKSGGLEGMKVDLAKAKELYFDPEKGPRRDWVGMYDSRMGDFKDLTGILGSADPKRVTFKSIISGLQNQILYLRSGKAINEAEFGRLMKELPDPNRSEVDFEARLANFERELNNIAAARSAAFGQAGYRNQGTGAQPPAPQQEEIVMHPDGKHFKKNGVWYEK